MLDARNNELRQLLLTDHEQGVEAVVEYMRTLLEGVDRRDKDASRALFSLSEVPEVPSDLASMAIDLSLIVDGDIHGEYETLEEARTAMNAYENRRALLPGDLGLH